MDGKLGNLQIPKCIQKLRAASFVSTRQGAFDASPYDDHPARTTPAGNLQGAFHGIETLAHADPIVIFPLTRDQAIDTGCLAKLEQLTLLDLFNFKHHPFAAKRIVAVHQRWSHSERQPFDRQFDKHAISLIRFPSAQAVPDQE